MNNRAGCAFFDEKNTLNRMYRLPDFCSIYTAELLAILKTLQYIGQITTIGQALILTDSQSWLQKLQCITPNTNLIAIEAEILQQIDSLHSKGWRCIFVWVKAHIGIYGNEKVDGLAKNATLLPTTDNHSIYPVSDLNRWLRQRLLKKWQVCHTAHPAGNIYKAIFPKISLQPWLIQQETHSKHVFKTMHRMRSGHCLVKVHLHRLGLVPSPNCENCRDAVAETLEHLILECPSYRQHRIQLLNNLPSTIHNPFNLISLISTNNIAVYISLYNYLRAIGRNI